MPLASLNGEIGPVEAATIPVTDAGLVRGDGVFEVVKLYGGRLFAWEDHLRRLQRSAANLHLPLDADAVRGETEALVARIGPEDHDEIVRIMVTRGGARIVTIEPCPSHVEAIALAPVTYAPPRLMDGIKSLSYGANMLATRLAQEQGAHEAVLVTPHGRVLEAPTSSLFWAQGEVLVTPPLSDHILDSITRRRVMARVEVQEQPTTLEDLQGAGEAFLASTTREVQPVARVGDVDLPAAPGPRTREAQEAFRRTVEEELGAVAPGG
jgi:branched-chain amino acid aminotransferase